MSFKTKINNRIIHPIQNMGSDIVHGFPMLGLNRCLGASLSGTGMGKALKRKSQLYIYNYLLMESKEVLKQFSDYKGECVPDKNAPVWIFWMQGYENAPSLVKKCIDSVRKSTAHPVHILSKDNLKDYCDIPEYIYIKYNKGIITNAQFSDILRMTLLSQYGGLWIDATIFVPVCIPEEVFMREFFTCKREKISDGYVSEYRWTGFLNGCQKNCVFQKAVKELIYHYWQKHDYLIDYLLIDYLILIVYNELPEAHDLLDSLPNNNPMIDELQNRFNDVYSETEYQSLINASNTYFFKLSWRMHFETTKGNKKTYFGRFVEDA